MSFARKDEANQSSVSSTPALTIFVVGAPSVSSTLVFRLRRLKVVMRHKDFATTEKFYGAMRSAQAAAAEVQSKLSSFQRKNPVICGGINGGNKRSSTVNG